MRDMKKNRNRMRSSALIKMDLFEESRVFLIKPSLAKCQKANNTSFKRKKPITFHGKLQLMELNRS